MGTQAQWVIAGLGNPDKEYEGTRHNAGREFLQHIEKKNAEKGKLFGKKATTVTPNSYMNNSGLVIKKLVPSIKAASQLIVLQDELDLPLGSVRLSFGSGSGGHRGVESIIKAIKTNEFIRIRIGISPSSPMGKLKKPSSDKIINFVLGKFKAAEQEKLKKSRKQVARALELILTEDLPSAMTEINAG